MALVNILLVLLIACGTVSADCYDGWTTFGNFCYRLFRNTTSWPLAKFECEKLDAYLATPDTQQKITYTKALMNELNEDANDRIWIGLTDTRREGVWVWELNENNVTVVDWADHEPNQGQGSEQNCAMMYGKGQFKWADDVCQTHMEFVCERPLSAPSP